LNNYYHYCSTHGYNCPYYHNVNNELALKGAAVLHQQQQRQQPQKQFLFSPKEMKFIDQVLKVAGYKVSGLEPQTEENKNMINDISNILKMISAKQNQKQNQSIKGASDMNRLQALDSINKIRNMLGLSNKGNKSVNQLKGASDSNNNNICNKKKSLINLLETFSLR
jgi:hypothetical protein